MQHGDPGKASKNLIARARRRLGGCTGQARSRREREALNRRTRRAPPASPLSFQWTDTQNDICLHRSAGRTNLVPGSPFQSLLSPSCYFLSSGALCDDVKIVTKIRCDQEEVKLVKIAGKQGKGEETLGRPTCRGRLLPFARPAAPLSQHQSHGLSLIHI